MSRYTHSADVIATDLGDELILLDPRNGEMFGLNACGRRVWQALSGRSVPELVTLMCAEFDVAPDQARVDVETLLEALVQARLVVHEDIASV